MACSVAARLSGRASRADERLLVERHRFAVGRTRLGFVPGLAAIGQGLVPHLTPQGMLRQPLHLVVPPVSHQGLKSLDDTGVQARAAAPAADSQTPPHV